MRPRVLITSLTLLLATAACGSTDEDDQGADAPPSVAVPVERTAELADPEGSVLGAAWLRDGDDGTEIQLDAAGLPTGLLDVGLVEADDCASVTADAPMTQLPGLLVGEDGTGALTTAIDEPSLGEILEGDGVAVVVTEARVDAPVDPDPGAAEAFLACASFSG